MTAQDFRRIAVSLPEATENSHMDHPDFRVGGKIFALAALDEVPPRVNVKCDPDLALDLRDRYEQVTPGYHMNKRHWNTVEIDRGIPAVELWRMVDHSYELVVKSLPKKTRANKQRVLASRSCR